MYEPVDNTELAYKMREVDNLYPNLDEEKRADIAYKMVIGDKQKRKEEENAAKLTKVLEMIKTGQGQPQQQQVPIEPDPARRNQMLQQHGDAMRAKQAQGGTFTNEDMIPYMQAGYQSPQEANPNTPEGRAVLYAQGAQISPEAGDIVKNTLALRQTPEVETTERVLYGPKGQTKVIATPKGKDYVPPENWSLDKGSVDYFGSPPEKAIQTAQTILPVGQKNPDALAGLDEGQKGLIEKLTDYKIPIPSGFALKSPFWQSVLERASLYDPTFDATQYQVRMGVRRDFTSGKSAQAIRSLNTAVAHLDTLQDKAKALDNSSITLWNRIANFGISQTGDKRVDGFNTAATAVEGELANVFKNTGATDQEIKAWRKNLHDAKSPEQIKESVNTAVQLLGGRLGALTNQYEMGIGKPLDFKILSDKSKTTLKKMGYDIGDNTSEQVTSQAQQGGVAKSLRMPDGTIMKFDANGNQIQ